MADDKVVSLGSRLKAASSILLARSRLGNLAGVTYEGDRDLYKYLGYKRTLSFDDYNQRYLRGGIAGRIVDAYPQATWRAVPSIFELGTQEEDTKGPFVKDFNNLARRLRLFHYFERADKLAGIGKYSILLIGVRGAGSLERSMPPLTSSEDVLFLAPFSENNAQVKEYETDPANSRFGLPKIYQIKLARDLNGGGRSVVNEQLVHYTRVLHISEGLLEDEIFGLPRLHRVWNYLDDLDKIVGGSAEAVWRTVDRGIQFDIDKDLDLDPDDETDMVDEIEEYVHNFKRYIKTRGVTARVLGSDSVDSSSPFTSTMSLIAGSAGIPQRILLGSESGQSASASDERNFASRVKERQQSFAEPIMIRTFIERLEQHGALAVPDEGYYVKWPDVNTLTAREKADVAARVAQAAKNISTQTKDSKEAMDPVDFRKRYLDEGN